MPELPEIEIVKRSLRKKINKAKIINIKIYNNNLRYQIPNNLPNKLINEKILNISRRSKYLIFHFKNNTNFVIQSIIVSFSYRIYVFLISVWENILI